MSLGDPYITAAELKSYLGISDTEDDTRVELSVDAVSRAVDKYCGRQFNTAAVATPRVFRPTTPLVVPVDDFASTVGLIVQSDPGADATYGQAWTAADYELHPVNGVVDGESGWPYSTIYAARGLQFPTATTRRASVQVTALWGWPAVPAPIRQACLLMAAEMFKLRDAPFGVAGFGEFGAVRVRSNPMATALLDPYRRQPIRVR